MQVGDTCYAYNVTGTQCYETKIKSIHKTGNFTVTDPRFSDLRFRPFGQATNTGHYKVSFDPAVKVAVERTKANFFAAQKFEKLYVHFRSNREGATDAWDSLPDEIKNLVK